MLGNGIEYQRHGERGVVLSAFCEGFFGPRSQRKDLT